MNLQAFKQAIRAALLEVEKPRECMKLQEGVVTENPYWGYCAQATEAGYILGQVLYGSEFRFKPFKNHVKGHASHYWLANSERGKENDICDLTDHRSDPAFNYSQRKLAHWINRKRSRDDIKKPNVLKIYDIVLQKLQTGGRR